MFEPYYSVNDNDLANEEEQFENEKFMWQFESSETIVIWDCESKKILKRLLVSPHEFKVYYSPKYIMTRYTSNIEDVWEFWPFLTNYYTNPLFVIKKVDDLFEVINTVHPIHLMVYRGSIEANENIGNIITRIGIENQKRRNPFILDLVEAFENYKQMGTMCEKYYDRYIKSNNFQ